MFKGIVLRDLEKPKVKNCEVNYCFKGFDLQDVNFAYLDKCSVYNARFDLTETHHSLQIFDVYNRSDNTLLYTINAGGIVTEGIKINDGYGFIIQGVNNKLRDCYTYMCGSDDYRVQNLGYTSKDNYFINCISDYPARYAFSVRSETCENTYFINCEARYGNDITKWNAIIPETLVDALLPPASNNEYDTWWTYRTPKRSCRHFYAHGFNTVFDNCKSFSKKPLEIDVTPRYTSNGEMTYLPSHLRTFNSHDILVKDSKFYGEVAGTGLIQMAGYNIDNKVTLDNCIIEGETGLSVSDTTYAGIYFSDNLLGEYLLKDNTINGCGDGYYFIGNINPKNFISKNNNLINQSRSNYFINTDITLSNGLNFIKETTRGARHSIDLRQPIRNIFFIDCDFKHTTASLNPIRLSNYNGTDINNIYFKEGSNYVMFIDALTTTTNRQSLFERIKINNIDFINILAENPSAGHLELLLKVIGNTITGSDINLMNVYNSSNVLRYLTIRRDAAGSNKSYFNIKVSNVDIAGLYKIYYTPLRNSTDLIV